MEERFPLQHLRTDHVRAAFAPVHGPHRMQVVPTADGRTWVNDSRATNVNSTWYALECMPPTRNVVWLAGGQDKGNKWEQLRPLVRRKVYLVVDLGASSTTGMEEALGDLVTITTPMDMAAAVRMAYDSSEPGHHILLSPACASFDRFTHYVQRGDRFVQHVRAL